MVDSSWVSRAMGTIELNDKASSLEFAEDGDEVQVSLFKRGVMKGTFKVNRDSIGDLAEAFRMQGLTREKIRA